MLLIGLMSGTSIDGVDASITRSNGDDIFEPIANLYTPYPIEFQKKLRQLMTESHDQNWLEIEVELTKYHADCVNNLLEKSRINKKDVSAIGFHGQTIFHDSSNLITWQIGNPHLLAKLTGINIISDFRRRDVAYGGQGAPLVPIFHKCLMRDSQSPVAVINIGGIANITYVDVYELIAFDLGPGNCLINDAMTKYYNKPYDDGGKIASSGKVHHNLIEQILDDPFFKKAWPKSLDRNRFIYVQELLNPLLPADIIATLTHLTVETIKLGIKLLPKIPEIIYVCGGGAYNETLMNGLRSYANIKTMKDIGLDIAFIESQAFAYLAARFLNNLPSTFPRTTGVSKPTIAGVMFLV